MTSTPTTPDEPQARAPSEPDTYALSQSSIMLPDGTDTVRLTFLDGDGNHVGGTVELTRVPVDLPPALIVERWYETTDHLGDATGGKISNPHTTMLTQRITLSMLVERMTLLANHPPRWHHSDPPPPTPKDTP